MILANPLLNRVSAAAPAEARGVLIRAAYSFLKDRFGERAVTAAVGSLTPEDRLLMPTVLLDANWYPHDTWRVIRRLVRVLDPRAGVELTVDMGRYVAEYAFKGIYNPFLSPDPVKQVEKFRWMQEHFYRHVCSMDVRTLGDSSATVSLRYRKGVMITGATCAVLLGFWARTLELAGGIDVVVSHSKCINMGSDRCEYSLCWR